MDRFLVLVLSVLLGFYLVTGGLLNAYRLGAEQREERRKAQWQEEIIEKYRPSPPKKWTEAGIDASNNGLKTVPERRLSAQELRP